jgi:hypothetical protein
VAAFTPAKADEKHPLASLGNAIVCSIEHVEPRFIPEAVGGRGQGFEETRPSAILGERLDVFHNESARSDSFNYLKEPPDVLASGIVGVHPTRHAEALAWGSTDHDVGCAGARRHDVTTDVSTS